jgi:O-antigen ligase
MLPMMILLVPLYIIGILLVIFRPEIIFVVTFVFTSTLFPLEAIPQPVAFGNIGFYLAELLTVLLTVRMLAVAAITKDFKKLSSPMTLPMVILLLWVIFSIFNAVISQRATLIDAVLIGRPYIFYMNFFLALYFIDTRDKLRFVVTFLIVVSAICTIFSFIQYIVGPETSIIPWVTWSLGRVTFDKDVPTLARVMPVSISVIFIMFFPMLVGIINKGFKKTTYYKILIVLSVLALFVSFTRNVYYSVIIGLFITWVYFRGRVRRRINRNLITVLLAALLMAYAPVFIGLIKVPNWWYLVAARPGEIMESGSRTETFAWRAVESRTILVHIAESPVIGKGVGATYYNQLMDANQADVHNGYLSIVFQLGLVGLVVFIIIWSRYVRDSFRLYRELKSRYLKSVVAGFVISFLALLPAVWVKPVFVKEYYWIAIIGFVWAVPEIVRRIALSEEQSSAREQKAL